MLSKDQPVPRPQSTARIATLSPQDKEHKECAQIVDNLIQLIAERKLIGLVVVAQANDGVDFTGVAGLGRAAPETIIPEVTRVLHKLVAAMK